MSDKKMWFGTRGFETWVPMFTGGGDLPKEGWSAESAYLNGGAGVRSSTAGHHVYPLAWPPDTRDAFRPVTDFADGVFGDGLIYFIDPVAADKNVLPQHWAFPGQPDGMPLIRGRHPSFGDTPASVLRYPAQSATYTLTGTETSETIYVPVPPGFAAWVGVHGSATGTAGVTVAPCHGTSTDGPAPVPLLSVGDSTRVSVPFDYTACTGVQLALGGIGSLTLSGSIVQVLRSGLTPSTGEFISGQGHSGCKFVGKPTLTPYIVADGMERVGLTAKLTEVGAWL